MEYVVEMGPGAMMHIPSFMKIGSSIQKLFPIGFSLRNLRRCEILRSSE
jgi:hypothetical protein